MPSMSRQAAAVSLPIIVSNGAIECMGKWIPFNWDKNTWPCISFHSIVLVQVGKD